MSNRAKFLHHATTPAAEKALYDFIAEKGWATPFNPYKQELIADVDAEATTRGYKRITKRQMRSLIARNAFPWFAWPGGYTLVYQIGNDTLCPRCARKHYRETGEHGRSYTHDEGPPIECDECGERIESSYGDPAEEEA